MFIHMDHLYLGSQISLKMPIIGIGAPAGIFLPRVAELLPAEPKADDEEKAKKKTE